MVAFCDAYRVAMAEALRAQPGEWVDTVETAESTALAERMVSGLARGAAMFDGEAKKVARRLWGITSLRDLRAKFASEVAK